MMWQRLKESWVVWLGMALMAVVPFLSSWRTGPQGGWFIESGSLIFASLFALLTLWLNPVRARLPAAMVYFVLLAGFWVVQARILRLPYPQMSDLTAAVFCVMALLAWACRIQVARLGQDRVVEIFAWALLAGALLQGLVCVFQFIGHTGWLPGLMRSPHKYFVFGQVGQRNHLGHYMMWGVLSLGYLWSRRRLPGLLAFALAVFLSQVVGVITSRTIILYVGALLLLLPFLYVLGGRPLRRWCAFTALLVLGVLAAQLLMPWLISNFLPSDVESSGVGRLVSGDAASPGRASEWAKAWTVFTENPWLGVGWQGYAHESFALAMRNPGFRNYDVGVLFTHSHNSMLEILAETGMIGALLVFGGWMLVAKGYLKKRLGASSALMLALMTVSLCHSLLEYPLWYVYFLTPFVVMMSLTPAKTPGWFVRPQPGMWTKRFGAAMAALAIAITVQYGFAYHRLIYAYANPTENYPQYKQVDTLRELEEKHYFLKYYAQMGIIRKIDWLRPLPEWGQDAALRASLFRPYANTAVRAFYLEQAGREREAADWLLNMGRYYPKQQPHLLSTAAAFRAAPAIVQPLREQCQRYVQTMPEAAGNLTCGTQPASAAGTAASRSSQSSGG
ncbi:MULTISPECIES: PglL family O-oligosaccharyltransferase [Eikenella]|uniref:Polymerase n=1 Tax=Eikenella longinqua TaxID=1795827 RepID=A0A1A9S0E8_9NEIS|nr:MULTISPECIES: Wzy polymerase domain-containing protein [Eikenella]OAM29993.1 polymerase [Eikenella longinqua]